MVLLVLLQEHLRSSAISLDSCSVLLSLFVGHHALAGKIAVLWLCHCPSMTVVIINEKFIYV